MDFERKKLECSSFTLFQQVDYWMHDKVVRRKMFIFMNAIGFKFHISTIVFWAQRRSWKDGSVFDKNVRKHLKFKFNG